MEKEGEVTSAAANPAGEISATVTRPDGTVEIVNNPTSGFFKPRQPVAGSWTASPEPADLTANLSQTDKTKINTLVSKLDDITQERIKFAYLKGRSETEISEIFGMTPDDVKLARTGLGVPRRLTGIPGSKAQSPAFIAWAQQYAMR